MEFVFEILALAALAVCVVCFLGLLTERYNRRKNRRIIRAAARERWLPLALLLFASAAALGQDNWVWHGCKPLSNGGYSLDPRCPNYGSYPTEQDNGVPRLSPWKSDYSRHVMTEEEMRACDCQLSGAEGQVEIQPNEIQWAKLDHVETIVYGPPVTQAVIVREPIFDPAEFMAEFPNYEWPLSMLRCVFPQYWFDGVGYIPTCHDSVVYYGDFPDGHMYVAEIPSAKRKRSGAKLAANLPLVDNATQGRCVQWMLQHGSIEGAEKACTKKALARYCAADAKYNPTFPDFDGFAKAVDCPQHASRPRGDAGGSGEAATAPQAAELTPLQRFLGSPMLAGLRF